MLAFLRSAGVHVVQTPVRAPNCNAHAERFVRSIKFECLQRTDPARRAPLATRIAVSMSRTTITNETIRDLITN